MAIFESRGRMGGQLVVDALRAHGVEKAFCVPGESYLAVLDALHDARDTVTTVACRHEHGAAVMAESYGKLTGEVGVCLVTRGPGACNASIGVHTAFQDSTPMLLLVGQVPTGHQGREAFQEVDFAAMFAPLAKWAVQVGAVEDVPAVMAEAFHVARSGRPGPVVVALPEDVLTGEATVDAVEPIPPEGAAPDAGQMERLHHILGDAQRPLMIVGGSGWTENAKADLVAFATENGLPVCCSFRRHDIFDNGHPNFVGELGIGASPALVARAAKCDVLLAVGTRLGEMSTKGYALFGVDKGPKPALVHVHASPSELGRVYESDLGIASTMPAFAAASRALAPVNDEAWRDWSDDVRRDYLADRAAEPIGGDVDLARIMGWLDERLPNDAVATVDAGNFSDWPQRYLRFGGGRRLLGATNGAMGYGVPAAVAASLSRPGSVVVGFAGDGGFGMTGQELATAVLAGASPILLVFDNGMYGTIRMHQERTYPNRVVATDLANPDYAQFAQAYGVRGETVTRTEDFAPAFERALAGDGPALIALRVDPNVISSRTTLAAIRGGAGRKDR